MPCPAMAYLVRAHLAADRRATFTAILPAIVAATTETVLTGQSVLILARRPEVGAENSRQAAGGTEPARALEGVAGHG